MSALPPRPYKYLAFFEERDSAIFFGREREIEVLIADIVTTRLVVLFARTGTGKSSLIRAGVRPRLRERNYRTVIGRVGRDPVEGLRRAADAAGLKAEGPAKSLAELLTGIVRSEKRPLVVFIDQFEEFFLNDIGDDARRAFIADVGTLYRTSDAGVHLVFSMREDYLAELDAFRDEIPTIFHKESQLRLRLLTREQARQALEGPSQIVQPPFTFEEGLVERIVDDLPREQGLILPVAVQIVGDSLWQAKQEPEITHDLYERLGKASGIIDARVSKDLGEHLTAEQLVLLERAIPVMHTKDWTKRPVSDSELRSAIGADPAELIAALIRTGLVQVESRGSDVRIEWVSDYISELSRDMTPRLRQLWLRKIPRDSLETIATERTIALLDDEAFLALLKWNDLYFLLLAAASSRDTLGQWRRRAGARPWPMIEEALNDPDVSEENAARLMQYLGEQMGGTPAEVLVKQLRKEPRIRTALRALGAVRDPIAIDAIRPFLKDEQWQSAAVDALRTIGTDEAIELADSVQKRGKSLAERLGISRSHELQTSEEFWELLIPAVSAGTLAGLIGPGLSANVTLERLTRRFEYPFANPDDVRDVMEYLSVTFGSGWQKLLLEDREIGAAYRAIAMLPLQTWLTTDYTDVMERALAEEHGGGVQSMRAGYGSLPRTKAPAVIHLLGMATDPSSIREQQRTQVLADVVPRSLEQAAHPKSLLVVGYERGDPEVSIVRDGLRTSYNYPSALFTTFMIASPPELASRRQLGRASEYFAQYSRSRGMYYFWGTAEDFVREFGQRTTKA